ncbi:MAG: TRAP transporter substrate-binding protein DctP [Saccharospirillum sp.]
MSISKRLFALSVGIGLFASEMAMANTEWRVSLWGERRAFTEHVERLAETLEARTNGEFTLSLHYGGLAPNTENLDGIASGDFEMAQICAGYHPEKNPALTVLELPFLGVKTLPEEIRVSMAVYRHPAVMEEMREWNAMILMPSPLPQYNIIGTGQIPDSLEDFDGMRIRATGGIGDALAILGVTAVPLPATEVRQALEANSIGGVSFAPHAHMAFGTVEQANWWTTNLNPGTVNCPVIVNTRALNRLSADHRSALAASIPDALAHYVSVYGRQTFDNWGPALEANGVEQVTFSPEELERLRARVAQPTAEAWIAQMEAQGIPGRALYDLVLSNIR